jgi:hypothetical protein
MIKNLINKNKIKLLKNHKKVKLNHKKNNNPSLNNLTQEKRLKRKKFSKNKSK